MYCDRGRRGTLVFVHGCDGFEIRRCRGSGECVCLGLRRGRVHVWESFFRARRRTLLRVVRRFVQPCTSKRFDQVLISVVSCSLFSSSLSNDPRVRRRCRSRRRGTRSRGSWSRGSERRSDLEWLFSVRIDGGLESLDQVRSFAWSGMVRDWH